jgi:mono/diheme cytochrome c family protein
LKRAIPIAAFSLVAAACARDDWAPDDLMTGKTPQQAHALERGRELYSTYCIGCHGPEGDGNGPAAKFLNPKPRDLRKGRVKFAAVPAGTMPRDEDLTKILDHGLAGTSMPTWRLLPTEDKREIINYLKTFSEVWTKEAPGTPVPVKPDPWRKKPEQGVAEGERVYHGLATCNSCHPAYLDKPGVAAAMKASDVPFTGFRDDMYKSVAKDSEWGAPITPPDFLIDRTKFAASKEELVQVIASGVGGTAMPSWGETLTPKQLWGLAYYVESLIQKRGTQEAKDMRAKLESQPPYKVPVDPGATPKPQEEQPK